MIVTFPHMGTLDVALGALLAGTGARVLPPPPTSKRTLELGTRHSPETACLPFKTGLGNFIEALEAGADTIVTCGGIGPCRLGYYAEIQRSILEDLGFRFQMVVVEPELASVWRALRRLAETGGWRQAGRMVRAFRLSGAKLAALDGLARTACFARPRAVDKDAVDKLEKEAVAAVDTAETAAAVAAAAGVYGSRLAAAPARRTDGVLRVGLVGEIYMMLDSFANYDLVRRLGHMGVEVRPTMLLGDYVAAHVMRKRAATAAAEAVATLARPYLGHYVGGHGMKSVGYTVKLGQAGIDGMIHVFPFTCMPETIARNVLPAVNRDVPVPVLSMACDELSGTAGMMTRLEAFVDLLCHRRGRGGNQRICAED